MKETKIDQFLDWSLEHPIKGLAALTATVSLLVLIITTPILITQAYFEARAYNKITGENVTTWDALWVEFRVTSK